MSIDPESARYKGLRFGDFWAIAGLGDSLPACWRRHVQILVHGDETLKLHLSKGRYEKVTKLLRPPYICIYIYTYVRISYIHLYVHIDTNTGYFSGGMVQSTSSIRLWMGEGLIIRGGE